MGEGVKANNQDAIYLNWAVNQESPSRRQERLHYDGDVLGGAFEDINSESPTIQHAILQSQISKTARAREINSNQEIDGSDSRVPAVKLLNRDLIASSENLNELSPKGSQALANSIAEDLHSGSALHAGTEDRGGGAVNVSRSNNQNKSQYLAKYSYDVANMSNNNSSSPL